MTYLISGVYSVAPVYIPLRRKLRVTRRTKVYVAAGRPNDYFIYVYILLHISLQVQTTSNTYPCGEDHLSPHETENHKNMIECPDFSKISMKS